MNERWSAHSDIWPSWVPYCAAAIVVLTLGLALHQRDMEGHGMLAPAIAAALAAAPFLFEMGTDLYMRARGRSPVLTAEIPGLYLWLFPLPVLLGVGLLMAAPVGMDFAPFVLVFMTAEIASRAGDRLTLPLATAIACGVLIGTLDVLDIFNDSFIWVVAVIFGMFGGLLISALARRTRQLESAQARLAEKAVTEERQRIAREVHDVIAHSASVTMLHVTAARMALEKEDEAAALESLREAEQQGRRSLSDIRQTVGLLGSNDGATEPPQPGVRDLPKLVMDFRSAGLDATLRIDGEIEDLPAATGLNIYRIAQESLTNVAKHAAGAKACVELEVTDEDIRLRVHNGPGNGSLENMPAVGSGLGIKGMAERAAMLGGSLATDESDDGWTVVLRAPRTDLEPDAPATER